MVPPEKDVPVHFLSTTNEAEARVVLADIMRMGSESVDAEWMRLTREEREAAHVYKGMLVSGESTYVVTYDRTAERLQFYDPAQPTVAAINLKPACAEAMRVNNMEGKSPDNYAQVERKRERERAPACVHNHTSIPPLSQVTSVVFGEGLPPAFEHVVCVWVRKYVCV